MCILFFSKWRKTVERILIQFLKKPVLVEPPEHI